jgi:uroporphyrinogen-III decarboxylase
MTTEKNWSDLSPEEKREERFNWWLSPPDLEFASPEAAKAYKDRAQRLIDVYKVREPDRVPVSLPVGALPAYLYGMDYHTVMNDYDKAAQAWMKFNKEFETDYLISPAMVLPGKVYELLDYKLYTWPSHGMPESAKGYQYVEGEYMKEDEYDALITDPSDFLTRVFMPRAFGALQPFSMLQSTIRVIELPVFYLMPYSMPPVQAAQQTLIEAGKELAKWMEFIFQFTKQGMEHGFPPMASGAFCKAPFDNLGDTLRGTKGIMMDMYRQRDKLIEAMDVLADMTIRSVLSTINATRGLAAIFPLHKGADGWMSDKQFETLYWPSLKKIIDALISEGILIILFAEGSFNTRLESVNEFPKGAVHWMFDRTDMARAKRILGDRCSISGNVPASLLVAGTPREVKEYCRTLVEICGKGGGYMLSSGTADITEARPDNVRAMMEAAKEYGVYK